MNMFITLFRSITMLCGIDNILQNISSFSVNGGIFHIRLSVPHNVVMDLNNVMFSQYIVVS